MHTERIIELVSTGKHSHSAKHKDPTVLKCLPSSNTDLLIIVINSYKLCQITHKCILIKMWNM